VRTFEETPAAIALTTAHPDAAQASAIVASTATICEAFAGTSTTGRDGRDGEGEVVRHALAQAAIPRRSSIANPSCHPSGEPDSACARNCS
jgi:hypothetical protein